MCVPTAQRGWPFKNLVPNHFLCSVILPNIKLSALTLTQTLNITLQLKAINCKCRANRFLKIHKLPRKKQVYHFFLNPSENCVLIGYQKNKKIKGHCAHAWQVSVKTSHPVPKKKFLSNSDAYFVSDMFLWEWGGMQTRKLTGGILAIQTK